MEYTFENVVQNFIHNIRGMQKSFPLVMVFMLGTRKKVINDLNEFVSKGIIKVRKTEDDEFIDIVPEEFYKIKKLLGEIKGTESVITLIPRSFIVSLISQFDAYFGNIIKTIYYKKLEILSTSEKSIKYSEIIKINSIDELKEYIIEQEIEAVLRKSHNDQFKWLENKLNMKLRQGLNCWPTFIESTERRNLFVHCDGCVSNSYIKNCKEFGVSINGINVGDKLEVTREYFTLVCNCILEIGIKLAHVIWRKITPDDRENADNNLNSIVYDFLSEEDYNLAIVISEFATNVIKKFSSEEIKMYLTVNKIQAYKWSGNEKTCKKMLHDIDWTALEDKFKLAYYVLLDDYTNAAKIMRRIGNSGVINKVDYKEWPLFKEFRKSNIFRQTYEEVFKEKLILPQIESENQLIKENILNEIAVSKEKE